MVFWLTGFGQKQVFKIKILRREDKIKKGSRYIYLCLSCNFRKIL